MRHAVPQIGDALEILVSVRHIEPRIWRRLRVPAELDLEEFHAVLQVTFGWNNTHLHAYQIGDVEFRVPIQGERDTSFYIEEGAVRLGAILRQGMEFTYDYDLGDDWVHDLRVERILGHEDIASMPVIECLAGQRRGPPEDCGGPPGYEHLLQVLANPSDPEYREMKSWIGRGYDPEAFDIDKLNKKLAMLGKRLGFRNPAVPGKSLQLVKH